MRNVFILDIFDLRWTSHETKVKSMSLLNTGVINKTC